MISFYSREQYLTMTNYRVTELTPAWRECCCTCKNGTVKDNPLYCSKNEGTVLALGVCNLWEKRS